MKEQDDKSIKQGTANKSNRSNKKHNFFMHVLGFLHSTGTKRNSETKLYAANMNYSWIKTKHKTNQSSPISKKAHHHEIHAVVEGHQVKIS